MRLLQVLMSHLMSPRGALGLTLLGLAFTFVTAMLGQAEIKNPVLIYIFGVLAVVSFLMAAVAFYGLRGKRFDKRRAVRQLLGDALEQGLNLQKGMYRQGERLRYANQEDIEMWVDRTHDFIQDVFDKPAAQRFLSREGYTDEELLGPTVHKKYYKKFPPRFLNDKYFVKARVKRLQELCQGNLPEINPDFNPEGYPSDWFRR